MSLACISRALRGARDVLHEKFQKPDIRHVYSSAFADTSAFADSTSETWQSAIADISQPPSAFFLLLPPSDRRHAPAQDPGNEEKGAAARQ